MQSDINLDLPETAKQLDNNGLEILLRFFGERNVSIQPSFFEKLLIFLVAFIFVFPLAQWERATYTFIVCGQLIVNSFDNLFSHYGLIGMWNEVFSLILTGLFVSVIGAAGTICNKCFFNNKKVWLFFSDLFTVVLPYWGISTFFLYKITQVHLPLQNISFNGIFALIIVVYLRIMCLIIPFYLITVSRFYTAEQPLKKFLSYPTFLRLKKIFRTHWSWTVTFASPWFFIALGIVHKGILYL